MIFFGWGTKKRDIVLDPKTHLIVMRSFFHFMFGFTITWNLQYVLARLGETGWGTQGITKEQAAQVCAGEAPDIHWWWRYSLLVLFIVPLVVGIVITLITSLF